MPSNEEKNEELLYKLILDRYNLEWKRTNDLDSKASNVTGFAGLLATLTVGITEFLPDSPYKYLLTIPLIIFILSAVLGLLAYWITSWEAINPEALIERYENRTKTETLQRVIPTISDMTLINYYGNQSKVKWILWAFIMLISAILLFFSLTTFIVMS